MADDILSQIGQHVKDTPILIFMKGSPQFPVCGFSAATIQSFDSLGVPYETVDVLQNPAVREGIKRYSNWLTIPQVYVKGEFIGGCDIIQEMHQSGELGPIVRAAIEDEG